MLMIIMFRTVGGDQLYWFAGFRPAHGIAIGTTSKQDRSAQAWLPGRGAGDGGDDLFLAVLPPGGYRLSRADADLPGGHDALLPRRGHLDLFVWSEVMGVAAYALTAYRAEERGSLQGALTFAITNSVGAYLSLSGIGLIYGRTGALNMAQIGAYINRHPPSGLVVVAFLLVISGLLDIKSAIVPFHFWLADAHAVAPTPVCVLLSGVMVELGLYGIARVYWSIFGQALGHRAAISTCSWRWVC